MALSRRNARTLSSIFQRPTPADIRWKDVETLLEALGADIEQRAGSRVAILIERQVHVIHTPHPGPTMNRATVRDIKALLTSMGITPGST